MNPGNALLFIFAKKIKVTKERIWVGIRTVLHILGCALFMYGFTRINVCRIYPYNYPYLDWILACFILLVGYSFYFFFVKKFYTTGFFGKFWLYVFLAITIMTIVEIVLLLPDFKIMQSCDRFRFKAYLLQSFFLVYFRNAGLVGLLVILRMNHYYRVNYKEERKTNIQVNSTYSIISNKMTTTLNVDEIVYIQHQKNYTYFYMLDGRSYSQYISLVKVEEEMPDGIFEYANRNTLINIHHHYSYKNGTLYLNEGGAANDSLEGISISKHYKSMLMDKINM